VPDCLSQKKGFSIMTRIVLLLTLSLLVIAPFRFVVCATPPDPEENDFRKSAESPEKIWGVKPISIRLTGADHFIDFRYQITDSDKATDFLKRHQKAFLVDQATGKEFPVPVTKLGPLRATAAKPKAGRQYVILFSNMGKTLKKGDRVTVVIGGFRAENLILQ